MSCQTGPATISPSSTHTTRHRPLTGPGYMTNEPPSLSPAPTGVCASARFPYHREHGSDPAGAGRRALRQALEHCVAVGYSAATVDFGMRGRAVCDPVEHQQDYCHFTAKAANALVPMGRLAESLELYRELRRRDAIAQVHMTCAYAIAMLHTRFFTPRDHDQALEWANSGRALASAEPDPIERAYFEVFADNGIALIEMHRGNLQDALQLVSNGMERLERELPADRYLVHRSQLLHNRARLLVATRRWRPASQGLARPENLGWLDRFGSVNGDSWVRSCALAYVGSGSPTQRPSRRSDLRR
jgi:hypothetical protein